MKSKNELINEYLKLSVHASRMNAQLHVDSNCKARNAL